MIGGAEERRKGRADLSFTKESACEGSAQYMMIGNSQ